MLLQAYLTRQNEGKTDFSFCPSELTTVNKRSNQYFSEVCNVLTSTLDQ